MKKLFMSCILAGSALGCGANDAVFSFFSYDGHDARFDHPLDGSSEFSNPILAGYYPDPSLTRKGDTYYLVNSSFGFFPGVPIFESEDLVNWRQIGHVLSRKSQLNLEGHRLSQDGIYAPAISYNPYNDTFYMITTLVGPNGGNFFVKTKDPAKGWSDPVWLPEIDGIDPSFLFDSDGKAYIVHNAPVFGTPEYEGERAIRLFEFDVENEKTLGDPVEIVRRGTHVTPRPIWIEGPHLYHIGDYYYLMCAEGGTAEDHSEVIFRARNPHGPWEESPLNPILTQRTLPEERPEKVTCTGHADLIQTADGSWWAVFLGCRPYEANLYNTGRDTFLLPVEWKDGWPVILDVGKSVPVVVKKGDLKPAPNFLSGNFAYTDDFSGPGLSDRWLSLRNAPESGVVLADGTLVLSPAEGTIGNMLPVSGVFARQQHPDFTVETELDFTPAPGEIAGLALVQNEDNNFVFGKTLVDGAPSIVLRRNEWKDVLIGSAPVAAVGPVKLKAEGHGRYYSFFYQPAGSDQWLPLAVGVDASNLSTARAGGFIGTVIGPYASRN